jgi:3-oxoacyl-[acyl-carrier-protein] synthase II
MSGREALITGLGLVTPLGIGVAENWSNLRELKTGIFYHPQENCPGILHYLGKVREFYLGDGIPRELVKEMKFLTRGSRLGFAAAREAFSHARIAIEDIRPGRRALYIASGDTTMVGYDFMYPATGDLTGGDVDLEKLNRAILEKVRPFFLLESIKNNLFSCLSAFLEFMGPNTSLALDSPAGANALELAWRTIKQGQADVAMVVGCGNWITEIPVYEMEGLGILSRCKEGAASFRPFDRRRDGFIPGEGGAAIVLEAAEVAARRGAEVYGKIRGVGGGAGFLQDRGLRVPDRVSAESMRSAVEEAGIDPGDLAFICPHGSGSQKGDRSELRSIQEVFGHRASRAPICGLKPYTGHLGAASDIAEFILGIKAAREGIVPATLNFRESEREFAELRISGSHQPCAGTRFLSTSYGMGGQASSTVVEVVG